MLRVLLRVACGCTFTQQQQQVGRLILQSQPAVLRQLISSTPSTPLVLASRRSSSSSTSTSTAANNIDEDLSFDEEIVANRHHLTARALAERSDLSLPDAVTLLRKTIRERREFHLREAHRRMFDKEASSSSSSSSSDEIRSFYGPEEFDALSPEALQVLRDDEKPTDALDRSLHDAYQTVFEELRIKGTTTKREWLPLLRTALTRYADAPVEVGEDVANYARATLKQAYREPEKWRPIPRTANVVTNDRGEYDGVSELFLNTSEPMSLAHLNTEVTFVPALEDEELLDYTLIDNDGVEPDFGLIEDPPDAAIFETANVRKPRIAANGTASGVGRRKSAVCRAVIAPVTPADEARDGRGLLTINGKLLVEYFPQLHAREAAVQPLLVTETMSKFRVRCSVQGGGFHAQAGAVSLAIARALQAYEPTYRAPLKYAGLMMRDPRHVERKKPGRRKARAKFAWVKR